jgi:microcystin-dependent protein/Tfp pilus assembly protein PilE
VGRKYSNAFTIVELIVVVVVMGIVAAVSVVSYGGWQRSIAATQLKSDLSGAASAMESHKNFNNTYPSDVLSVFSPSDGVAMGGGSSDGLTYCVDAVSIRSSEIVYYIEKPAAKTEPQEGTCATRPIPPSAPGNVAVVSSIWKTIRLSWVEEVSAASYTAQCASNSAFTAGLRQVNVTQTNATIEDLVPSSSYYCRVNSMNDYGTSEWSPLLSTNTSNNYGSLAVGTSVEGYWTTAPDGYLLEDGSAVSRTTYADLFALIGITYGAGNGSTTFNLPDSSGRVSVNRSTSDSEFNTIGKKSGTKTETLTIAQMPSHTHIQNAHTHTQNAHNHNNGAANPYLTDGSLGGVYVASAYGGDFGYRYNTAPSATATNQSTVAVNQNTGGGGSHSNIQPSIAKNFVIKYAPIDSTDSGLPQGSSIDGYWSTAPDGYLLEDGSAVSRTTYAALFAVIGTTHGAGNGSTTFNLPDSRGRASVGGSPSDSEFNAIGKKSGSKSEAITVAQMPSHTHVQNAHTHTQNAHDHNGGAATPYVNDGSFGGALTSAAAGSYYGFRLLAGLSTTAVNQNTTATNQNTGGGDSHNNIQPSIVKVSAIKHTPATEASRSVQAATSISGYWSTVPAGYLLEDGSAVSRVIFADLFAVIGTTYGSGDGWSTFNLPDSRGRLTVNVSSSDTEFNTVGKKSGSKSITLASSQMPSHTHVQNAHTHTQSAHHHNGSGPSLYVNTGSFGGTYAPTATGPAYGFRLGNSPSVVAVNQNTTAVNQNTGGGEAHNNIQPSIVKMFVIKY